MDQQKINYLIIGAVVIFLLVLGVYYYQTKEKLDILPNNVENTVLNNPSPTLPEGEGANTLSPINPPLGGGQGEVSAKFNTVMDNARLAFRNKDYFQAITYYKKALTYQNTDTPYSGLFYVYVVQGTWAKALEALDSAIKINPLFVDYWKSKIEVLSEQTSATFQDLKDIYNEGLIKVDPKTKIDLITFFATMAENIGQKSEAITVWEYAKQVYPTNSAIYQAEIDRLQGN